MSIISEKEFVKKIKENVIDSVYFLFGDENYLIDYYQKSLVSKILDKNVNQLNFTEFDMDTPAFEEIEREISSLSMFSQSKCIHLKFLDPTSYNKIQTDKLKNILMLVPENMYVIITSKKTDDIIKKNEKWQKFLKTLSAKITCVELMKKTENELVKFIVNRLKKANITISDQDARDIVRNCSDDIETLTNETDKLIAFTESGTVSKESIEKIITLKSESEIFLMVNDIINFRNESALSRLDTLFYNNEEPVQILSVITTTMIDLYRAKAALSSNSIDSYETEIMADFSYPRILSFKIRNAIRDCKKYSIDYLRFAIEQAEIADISLKSTNNDKIIILQTYVATLLSTSKNHQ